LSNGYRGNWLCTACATAGTTKETFNYWRRLYEAKAEHAQKYADFFTACARASAIAEEAAVEPVFTGAMGWQGPAWWLQRRFPKRWGNKETVIHKDGDLNVKDMTDEQLESVVKGKSGGRT